VGGYIRHVEKTIAIGSDHAGFELKKRVKERLNEIGWRCTDFGTNGLESMDYPDPAHAVAHAVESGEVLLGVLICGSGNGVSMAANRHKKVRCALAWAPEVAALGRKHNDANILALPARFVSTDQALAILDAFIAAEFEGGRHQRRVEKIEGC
jgi:ribose 5-phosphate isomerase B